MMSKIDFAKKMNYHRPVESTKCIDNDYEITQCFESDRGRIINSAAIRRLQQKTQVFPLERNAVVRSRLTHSMEVQQVGRHIAKEIINRLAEQDKLKTLGLDKWLVPFESMIEMACLMHDIGNPPFGHFGESAINDWFRHYLDDKNKQGNHAFLMAKKGKAALNDLKVKIKQDLCNFEGNAQSIRLVHSLLKLNLTYAQTACILKYTRPAYWLDETPPAYNYLMKKPGYYLSEEAFVTELRKQLELEGYNRYPLTYIMEAADDISYCIADLEDAVEKDILTVQQLYTYLEQAWGKVKNGDLFAKTVKEAYQRMDSSAVNGTDQFFLYLRVNTIKYLVAHAAERFIENLPAIFAGSFNQALLESEEKSKSMEAQLLGIYKTVAFNHVFNHESVELLELQGYRVITGLLDIYSPLLKMSTDDFILLSDPKSHKHYLIETRLFHKLSIKHRLAYQEALKIHDKKPKDEFAVWEFYYRCRLIQDYISGMTDHFAYDEYRKLMVTD